MGFSPLIVMQCISSGKRSGVQRLSWRRDLVEEPPALCNVRDPLLILIAASTSGVWDGDQSLGIIQLFLATRMVGHIPPSPGTQAHPQATHAQHRAPKSPIVYEQWGHTMTWGAGTGLGTASTGCLRAHSSLRYYMHF